MPVQYVTLVAQGGTPVRLANQQGAPYPTTGTGALVFATSPEFINPIITGRVELANGVVDAPTLYFGTDAGFWSSDGTDVRIATGGADRAVVNSGGLTVVGNFVLSGTILGATWNGATISPAYGGTGISSYAAGDLLYATGATTLAKLPAGTNGQVLTLSGGLPVWATDLSGVTSFSAGTTGLTPSSPTTGAVVLGGTLGLTNGGTGSNLSATGGTSQVLRQSSVGAAVTVSQLAASDLSNGTTGSGAVVLASGAGISSATLTSVSLVTSNLGTPTAAVLTNATGLPLSTGVTGTLGIANGGTGQTTANNAINALLPSQGGNSGKFLTTDGTNSSWASPVASATSVTVGTTTVISGTSGYILYNNAGVLGNLSVTGTAGSAVLSNAPTIDDLRITTAIKWGATNWFLQTGGYSVLYDGTGRQNVFLGGTGDPTNYYRNSVHFFQTAGAAANILNLTGTLATFAVQINYGGVTIGNSVTGDAGSSLVLSANPTFTGTVSYSSMTGTNLYTVNGVMQMTRDSATGGGLLFIDSASGGQNWQAGPGSGTGNKDYWGLYNFGTTTTVLQVSKNGNTIIPGSLDFSTAATVPATMGMWNSAGVALAIKGGSSGVIINNNANNATNFTMTDAGNITLRTGTTLSGYTYTFTTADTAVGGRIAGTTGKIRLWGYYAGASTIDGAVANETTYGPLRVLGNPLYLSGNGVDVVTVTSTLVAFGVTANIPTANITSGILWNGANWFLQSSGYSILYDGSARQNIFMGGTGDPSNYYRNTTHAFQSVGGGANFLTMSASYVEFGSPMRYGGVTLGSNVVGTGNLVLATNPSITGQISFASLSNSFIGATGGDFQIAFDSGDYIYYQRGINTFYIGIGSTNQFTMTSTVTTITNVIDNNQVARAWVEWTGGGTTINRSYNVSSITRNAAGSYYVNFTTAAPATTYAALASGENGPGLFVGATPVDTTKALVLSGNTLSQVYQDANVYSCVCFW